METLKDLIDGTKKLRGEVKTVKVGKYKRKLSKSVFSARCKLKSSDSGHTYNPSIEWIVEVSDKKKAGLVKVKTVAGKVSYMKLPRMSATKCRVRCNCQDFIFTFAPTLTSKGSLMGDLISIPKPKGTGKPRNPKHIPGICKHIAGLAAKLRKDGQIK